MNSKNIRSICITKPFLSLSTLEHILFDKENAFSKFLIDNGHMKSDLLNFFFRGNKKVEKDSRRVMANEGAISN